MNTKSLFNTNRKRPTASLVAAGVLAVPMLVGNTYTHNLMPISSVHAASDHGQGGQGAGGAMKGQGGIGGAGGYLRWPAEHGCQRRAAWSGGWRS